MSNKKNMELPESELKKVTILVPAFNEAKNLPHVMPRFIKVCRILSQYNWVAEVVFINDGSLDNTAKLAFSYGATIISHPFNMGYGAALQTGYWYADRSGSQVIVTIDADGQHNPEDIIPMLKAFKQGGYDVVIGSRFVQDTGYKAAFARLLGIKLFSWITKILTHQKIYDVTSGFQIMSRKPMQFLVADFPHDYPDAEIIILLIKSGFNVGEFPIKVNQRLSGKSMHTLFSSIKYPFRSLIAITVVLMKSFMTKREGK